MWAPVPNVEPSALRPVASFDRNASKVSRNKRRSLARPPEGRSGIFQPFPHMCVHMHICDLHIHIYIYVYTYKYT